MLAEVLVSADPLVLPDALVSAGAPAPELGCARMDLILCIASNLRCLIARSSSILFSLLALKCEVSDGDKPGGIVAEGGTFEESFFSELAIEGRLEASPHALLLFLSRPMPSLVRLMQQLAQRKAELDTREKAFGRCILFLAGANYCQRNKHREDKESFHIRGRIFGFC